MIRLAMFTGCNFNELRALTWDTVSLDDGTLVTCGAHRNGPRRFYLNSFAQEMLRTFQRLRCQRLVFSNTKG
jgi:integrase